jgi:hypothetical protein
MRKRPFSVTGISVPSRLKVRAAPPPLQLSIRQAVRVEEASPLGVNIFGQLTAVSAAPANAANHATGKRIRDLAVTVEKLL